MIEYVQIVLSILRPVRNKNFTNEKFQVFHVCQLQNDAK